MYTHLYVNLTLIMKNEMHKLFVTKVNQQRNKTYWPKNLQISFETNNLTNVILKNKIAVTDQNDWKRRMACWLLIYNHCYASCSHLVLVVKILFCPMWWQHISNVLEIYEFSITFSFSKLQQFFEGEERLFRYNPVWKF